MQETRDAADYCDSDDNVNLWHLQTVKKKEANDATKRAVVTKEKESKKKEDHEKKRS